MMLTKTAAKILLALPGLPLAFSAVKSGPHGPPMILTAAQISWTAEAWAGNDQPYQAMRTEIDDLAAAGKLTGALIGRYEREHERTPNDPQAIFRYAYAFYEGRQLQPPINPQKRMSDLAFEAAPSPYTYNYTRTRFLANATYIAHPQFIGVAKRLLKRDPADYDVEYNLIRCFKPWTSPAMKQETLNYTDDLIHRHPNRPGAYSTLAYVYFATWMARHNRPDAQNAIAAYRKYLQLAPANASFRAVAEGNIKYIEERTSE